MFCPQLAKSWAEHGANDNYWTWWCCQQFSKQVDEKDREETALRLSDKLPGVHPRRDTRQAQGAQIPAHLQDVRRGASWHLPVLQGVGPGSPRPSPSTSTRSCTRPSASGPSTTRSTSSEPPTAPTSGPLKALGEVEHGLVDLKARNPGLARDCAYRLMALIVNWGWPEDTAKSAGVAAGLDEADAARWARKLYDAHPPAPLPEAPTEKRLTRLAQAGEARRST